MLELQNEVEFMFNAYGIKFETESFGNTEEFEEELAVAIFNKPVEEEILFNEETFLQLQKRVLDLQNATDQEIAQYTFLNENFSMDPTEYRFGEISPISKEDEKFDPLDNFHIRFGQEEKSSYDGGFEGPCAIDTYGDMKWRISLDDRPYEDKKDRVGIKKRLLKQNSKFSLFSTTGSGEVWIPNCMSSDSKWALDHIDQDMATWDRHVKKIKRF